MIKIIKTEKNRYTAGWDVTVEISNETKNIVMTFYWPRKEQPDEKILAGKFTYLENQFNDIEPQPENSYLQSEIDRMLIDKKYLIAGQHFPSDLPVKPIGGK